MEVTHPLKTRAAGKDYLHEASGIITVKVHDEEAFIWWEVEVLQTGLHELERGRLGSFGFSHLALIYRQQDLGIQSIVDGHEGITLAQTSPHGFHWIDRAIGTVIFAHLIQVLLETRNLTQALT